MERIVYRIPLDATKSGIQGTLQGFMTGDILSRRIEITLSSRGKSVVLTENEAAAMYVHKTGADEPSINACTIEDGKAIYDVLQSDVDTVGITKMQLKIVSGERVLMSPYFAIEVTDSMTGDTQAVTTPTYTALEQALAQAQTVYNERIVSVDLSEDLLFRVDYADGSFYESTAIADKIGNIDVAEAERVRAEELRVSAEEERAFAERNRVSLFTAMQNSVQNALDTTKALQESLVGLVEAQGVTAEEKEAWNKKADGIKYAGTTLSLLSGEETIATTTIIGGGGGTVVLPDNVLVASDVTAADVEAPKINADLFGSLPPSDYAKTTDVNAIKDGTTQVGNAKTLDGHGAEYFASTEAVKNNELWTDLVAGFDLNEALGKYRTLKSAIVSTLLNKPDGVSGEITVEWYPVFSDNQYGLQILRHTSKGLAEVYFRSRYNITWSEWEKVFTTFGDTMKPGANLYEKFEKKGSEARWFGVKNNDDTVFGAFGAYAESGVGKFVFIGANGTESFKAAQGLTIYPDKIQWKLKDILHTGNKPTGTYTGNGDATSRRIAIGGIGNVVIATSVNGFALCTLGGAIIRTSSGELSQLSSGEIKPLNGYLNLATANSVINGNGVEVTYTVL